MKNRSFLIVHSCITCALLIMMNSSVLAQAKDSTDLKRYAGIYGGLVGGYTGLGLAAGYFYAAVWGTQQKASIHNSGSLSSNEYKEDRFFTLGIPLQVQLFFTPLQLLGIGLVGCGNVNLKMSVWGVALCVQFGTLR